MRRNGNPIIAILLRYEVMTKAMMLRFTSGASVPFRYWNPQFFHSAQKSRFVNPQLPGRRFAVVVRLLQSVANKLRFEQITGNFHV